MNTMTTKSGKVFGDAKPEEVLSYLKGLDRRTVVTAPHKLKLSNKVNKKSDEIFLEIRNGTTSYYPIRESFLLKLMRWYHLTELVMSKFGPDTIVAVGNDFLSHIRSGSVTIKIENGDALTILSPRYSEFTDAELLEMCKDKLEPEKVTRDDFAMRVFSKEILKTQPVKGDDCGFGYNIFNSETGFMAIRVSHYILRYWCSNGAIAKIHGMQESMYHYGQPKEKIMEFINESIQKIEEGRGELIKKLLELRDKPALENVKGVLMRLRPILGIAESTNLMKEFTEHTEGKYGETEYKNDMYSLFNFITHSAKERPLIQRTQMEELAGGIVWELIETGRSN